jgi:Tol biopolymer transport system component
MEQPVEGQGGAAILLEYERTVYPTSVSPDGKTLLLDWEREDSNLEIRMMSLENPDGEATMLASSEENLAGGKYSPDGRWIAYHTTSSEGWDVFVIPATGGARKWQVSTEGAVYPLWSHDGTELWATPFNGAIRAFKVDGTGQTFRVGGFRETGLNSVPDADGSNFDLDSRENRILQTGTDPAFQSEVSYLHLVTDWQRGLVQ